MQPKLILPSQTPDPQASATLISGAHPAPGSARSWTTMVTPDMAQWLLSTMHYIGQRPLRPDHVNFLASEIKAGRFRTSTIDIRDVGEQGYLINGQHRLHAIIAANQPTLLVVVRLPAASVEEVARDYAAFDRGLIRSHRDGMAAANLEAETGLTKHVLEAVQKAAPYILGGFTGGELSGTGLLSRSTQARIDFVRTWAEPALLLGATIGDSERKRIRRMYNAACFSVMLVTFRYAPQRAELFWGSAARNDGLRQGDPALTLLEFLTDHPVTSRRRGIWYSRAIATIWNAAYEERRLKLVKVYDTATPIRIAGTPYDGQQHHVLSGPTEVVPAKGG